jgi:GNAT superfamily N-acetyltransferase
MPHTTIRPATAADCPRLLELVKELAAFEKAPEAVTVSLDHFVLSGFGPEPVWWGQVAEVDGVVEGFTLYYIRYSTWKGQRLYLEDFYVTDAQRGKGVGKLLFDATVEAARERGLAGMSWQVLEWNRLAIDFYKKYPTEFDGEWVNCGLQL